MFYLHTNIKSNLTLTTASFYSRINYKMISLRRKFIAYDPNSGTLLKLKEHFEISKTGLTKIYLSDINNNFVYNHELKKIFEIEDYKNNMIIKISRKKFYLISEF